MARSINQYVNLYAFEDYLDSQRRNLPDIPEVSYLSNNVIRILGGNPGQMQLQGTNTYIVGTGSRRLLVDTGEGKPRWAQLISQLLKEKGITICGVLLTHWHGDHTGGSQDLIRLYPNLRDAVYKYAPDEGQQAISDGQTFAVEGATLRALFTPGHSTDHVCFVLEEENAMFTGDNILGHGTTAVEKLGDYMDSLSKMQVQQCQLGYPGHGAVVINLRHKLQLEVGQKKRREYQVLSGLEKIRDTRQAAGLAQGRGSATSAELVVEVFGQLPDDIGEAIFEPFMNELLMKLAGEKRVGFELQGGRKRWFVMVGIGGK
ncbi:beta-lactamase-like protein [Aspergillus cavernicola]|uniref:Beta-lactamase-like protein n=1 Tax=Aspergillus cavernicola TaxID=176166 RepID=A0ABR4HT79_9EURO